MYYENPLHNLTALVEVSVTSGEPSARKKSGGIEHPMWAVCREMPAHIPSVARGSLSMGEKINMFVWELWELELFVA